tara:strand:- start:234 stop:425 length:192 start_codon:yes stop_codon:yes gene_type:complete
MGEKKIEPMVDTKFLINAFGLSKDFIEDARKHLGFPFYQLSKKNIRFRLSEVEQWLKGRKVNG